LINAQENHSVIAVSRSIDLLESLREECFSESGKEIEIIASDFSKFGFHNEVKDTISKKHDHLDALINNAGMLINKKFLEINRRDIEDQMRINFEAPLQLIQQLMPLLMASGKAAHVVNIGSMGGFQGSEKFSGLSAYSASKGALAILTECLAAEFMDSRVSFNCLALGSADTEMLRKAFPDYKSPTTAKDMASFIVDFTLKGHRFFNGKIIPVAGLSK
jgi:short-subunit dehydrogenase